MANHAGVQSAATRHKGTQYEAMDWEGSLQVVNQEGNENIQEPQVTSMDAGSLPLNGNTDLSQAYTCNTIPPVQTEKQIHRNFDGTRTDTESDKYATGGSTGFNSARYANVATATSSTAGPTKTRTHSQFENTKGYYPESQIPSSVAVLDNSFSTADHEKGTKESHIPQTDRNELVHTTGPHEETRATRCKNPANRYMRANLELVRNLERYSEYKIDINSLDNSAEDVHKDLKQLEKFARSYIIALQAIFENMAYYPKDSVSTLNRLMHRVWERETSRHLRGRSEIEIIKVHIEHVCIGIENIFRSENDLIEKSEKKFAETFVGKLAENYKLACKEILGKKSPTLTKSKFLMSQETLQQYMLENLQNILRIDNKSNDLIPASVLGLSERMEQIKKLFCSTYTFEPEPEVLACEELHMKTNTYCANMNKFLPQAFCKQTVSFNCADLENMHAQESAKAIDGLKTRHGKEMEMLLKRWLTHKFHCVYEAGSTNKYLKDCVYITSNHLVHRYVRNKNAFELYLYKESVVSWPSKVTINKTYMSKEFDEYILNYLPVNGVVKESPGIRPVEVMSAFFKNVAVDITLPKQKEIILIVPSLLCIFQRDFLIRISKELEFSTVYLLNESACLSYGCFLQAATNGKYVLCFSTLQSLSQVEVFAMTKDTQKLNLVAYVFDSEGLDDEKIKSMVKWALVQVGPEKIDSKIHFLISSDNATIKACIDKILTRTPGLEACNTAPYTLISSVLCRVSMREYRRLVCDFMRPPVVHYVREALTKVPNSTLDQKQKLLNFCDKVDEHLQETGPNLMISVVLESLREELSNNGEEVESLKKDLLQLLNRQGIHISI